MPVRKKNRANCTIVVLMTILCIAPVSGTSPASHDALSEGFLHPPSQARPRVWWHWMSGNVTEEGIRADLEWMKRIGIGGVQNFDAAFESEGIDKSSAIVASPLEYLTPAWRHAFRSSVALADRLGLEYAIASSPGWSISGGPWVMPGQAMKKLVWSETAVVGGASFSGCLKRPPGTTGYFQDIPVLEASGPRAGQIARLPAYYADVAAIAYRLPASEARVPQPVVTTSAGPIEAARLTDGDLARSVALPYGEGPRAWIDFRFPRPERIQALTFVIVRPLSNDPLAQPGASGWLEASDDGEHFRKVTDLSRPRRLLESTALEQTLAFPPVTARIFRLTLERPAPPPASEGQAGAPPQAHEIAELVLHAAPRVHRFEDKAGFSVEQIMAADDTPEVSPSEAVRPQDVVDLTARMRPDGCLEWNAPAGRWRVLRFGYSLTGSLNRPAAHAGVGLEVDKLSRAHVKAYMDAYLGEYEHLLAPDLMGARGLQYLVTDSYEAGPQNWTDNLLEDFRVRRNYDLRPWLPVLAGRVVESAAASDRVLWDFRQTLAELMAEAHYGQITASVHGRGLRRYGESHEYNRFLLGDGMDAKRSADIPMGAMSTPLPDWIESNFATDLRESASVAHIYGQNLVAAESFTAYDNTYGFAPEDLKPVADKMLSLGVNLFVIHTSVHQPGRAVGPGLSLGHYGQWFTRKETWANQARSWVDYLARSSYLLQQGRSVADIAYLYGEDTNLTSLFYTDPPPVPQGFGFDFVNASVLLNELSVKEARLVTRRGGQYRLLALDRSTQRMRVPLLRKLRDLVREGAIIVGTRPAQSPSQADDPHEFNELVTELWDGAPAQHAVGAGRVFSDVSIQQALRELQIAPDLEVIEPAGFPLPFIHRALDDGELYHISNPSAELRKLEISLRADGRLPEIWRADDGTMSPVSYRMEQGRTIVSLQLEAREAVFIVLRKPTAIRSAVVQAPTDQTRTVLNGPWELSFPPNMGAPAHARFDRLHSWAEDSDAGIRYFSGTASYSRSVRIPRNWLKDGSRVVMDLGMVKNVAEIRINGAACGVLWKTPFRADVTRCLSAGANALEIQITNLWPNRLIGDHQPGARKIAFAAYDPFTADSALLPSGLLGPVTLTLQNAGAR